MDEQANSPINPKSGFNSSAKTFHNLRPPIHLPPEKLLSQQLNMLSHSMPTTLLISPANPISTESEISHQISLSNPVIAFAISKTCHKLPKLKHGTILIDSPEFDSIITMSPAATTARQDSKRLQNLMAVIAGYYPFKQERKSPTVMLYTVPYFHVFGFFYSFKSVALSETVVVMERFDLKKMLRAVEKF
uniref:AMP-dependent synthetase/ligase domain-containing protein n=1 Tax=Populus alba TaxID=43335 RepID=A0A4U5QD43_POPAL|nr:hypothetical protein D5086_0000104100 [Populus alba]